MTIHTAAADPAVFIDRRKTLWLFALGWLSLPALGSFVAVTSGSEFYYWLVPLVWFGLIPLVDLMSPLGHGGTSEAQAEHLDSQAYYSFLIDLAVPATYATLIYSAWAVSRSEASAVGIIGIGLSLGIIIGTLITISRAYARGETRTEKVLAFLATAIVGFGHFRLAHTVAHQRACATPGDPASSRMGESVYKFFMRSLPASIEQAWVISQRRHAQSSRIKAIVSSEIVQSLAFAVVLHGALIVTLGPRVLPMLLIAAVFAWFFQTTIGYVQHYGLLREKRADGAYVRCSSRHAWNSAHAGSSLLMFNGTCHAAAHAHPGRRYQSLAVEDGAAELPVGFATAMIIAAIPRLWCRLMDPAVAKWANGDLLRVNIDGGAYTDLMAKYHRPGG